MLAKTEKSGDGAPSFMYTREGRVARLHFNRPHVLNAIDAEVAQSLVRACREISRDDGIRVVVLSGEGRAFVSGGDLRQFRSNPADIATSLIDPMHEAVTLLASLQAPVIASLHGAVAGAGFSLAMACDLAVASEDTRFNLAYINVATSCDVSASWTLPRLVGLRKALEIALLNEPIDAAEALRLGLVNWVVPTAALQERTGALVQRLADGPAVALGHMKRLMRDSWTRDLGQQLDAERRCFSQCASTADFSEALTAFFTRRTASYTGQ